MAPMAIRTESNGLDPKHFNSFESVLPLGRTLCRLATLDHLSPAPTQDILNRIRRGLLDAWAILMRDRSRDSELYKSLSGIVERECRGHDGSAIEPLVQFLSSEIRRIKTSADEQKWQRRFEKDIQTLYAVPLRKTELGDEGPTYLVEYFRARATGTLVIQSYVIKWTNWNEIHGNLAYGVFSKAIASAKHPALQFYTPMMASFDQDTNTFISPTGTVEKPKVDVAEHVYQCFNRIVQLRGDKRSDQAKQLVFFEKIKGQDLLEFARLRYSSLTDAQKKVFFKQLAALSTFDILLGHNDRLIHVDYEGSSRIRLPLSSSELPDLLEANLGNVMVSWPSDQPDPVIFAIDNGLEAALLSAEYSASHVAFLRQLFQLEDPEIGSCLGRNVIACLSKAFSQYLKGLKEDPSFEKEFRDASQNLEPLCIDLTSSNTLSHLKEGHEETIALLRDKSFVPNICPFLPFGLRDHFTTNVDLLERRRQ